MLRDPRLPFRALIDAVPDGIIVVDRDGVLVLLNAAAERMFGYEREELTGQNLEVLIPEELRARHRHHLAAYGEPPGPRPMASKLEIYGRRKDGGRLPVEVSLSPLASEAGALTIASVRDVTERRAAERTKQQRTAELEEARQLAEAASAAKSEFLSSMSHELRTPLNAILGFAQLLQRDRKQPLSERQLERLEHVLRGGEHLLRLIDDVLDLAQIEAGRITISLEPVVVTDVLSEVVHILEPMAAREHIEVSIAAAAPPPHVLADRTRLTQILMNFGSNATKYGKPGGHLVFRTEPVGDMLRILVQDDGIGIPEAQRDKLFEPFQRAGQENGPIEGTGIGLTISKRLAELMHGAIGFTSSVDRGSDFWIDLPVLPQRGADAALPSPPSLAPSLLAEGEPRHTIAYVEDNPSNIAFMRALVAELPSVQLLTAATGELAIDLIRAHRPKVVIMDINLPGMSGIETARRLKDWPETRDIPVVALSAAALFKDAARAEAAGFHRYLTKPVKVDELLQTLEELLEQG